MVREACAFLEGADPALFCGQKQTNLGIVAVLLVMGLGVLHYSFYHKLLLLGEMYQIISANSFFLK